MRLHCHSRPQPHSHLLHSRHFIRHGCDGAEDSASQATAERTDEWFEETAACCGKWSTLLSAERRLATKSMKRSFTLIVAVLAAVVLFGGLVYAVLVAAHVSQPASNTVYGLTPRRLWATIAAGLALVGVVVGVLAVARPYLHIGVAYGRLGAIVALVAGLTAAVNGGMVLGFATGGPGAGSGVVGGAGALVLGLIAVGLSGMALARFRRFG